MCASGFLLSVVDWNEKFLSMAADGYHCLLFMPLAANGSIEPRHGETCLRGLRPG